MLDQIVAWLGKWETPQGGINEGTQFIPAVGARGYQYYPKAVPMFPKEKADFSRAPQLNWWMDKKKDPSTRGKRKRI